MDCAFDSQDEMVMGQEASIDTADTKINEVLIVLLSATYFINLPIVYALRPVDIIFCLFAAFNIRKLMFRVCPLSVLVITFWVIFFVSIANGIINRGIIQKENFVFIYKYALLFIFLKIILSTNFKEEQITFLIKILFTSLLLMVIYTIYLKMFWRNVPFYRPCFPFTKAFPTKSSGYLGDAHLLSAYLSTGLLAFVMCHFYNLFSTTQKKYSFFIFCSAAVMALIVTGSRNGVITLGISGILWVIAKGFLALKNQRLCYNLKSNLQCNWLHLKRSKKRISSRFVLGTYFAVISVVFLSYSVLWEYDLRSNKMAKTIDSGRYQIPQGVSRTFYFNFWDEQSSFGRVQKQLAAYKITSENGLLIGVGMQSCSRRFFDGAIGNLLICSGVLGTVVFIAIILFFLAYMFQKAKENDKIKEFQVLFWVFLNYSLACLITEFFLVSRCVIPFLIFVGLIGRLILAPKK